MIYYLYMAACFMIPNIIWQIINRKKMSGDGNAPLHLLWSYIFMAYCAGALFVANAGTLWDLIHYRVIIGGINLVPFVRGSLITHILNIVMFMPFGFMLPLIWDYYRDMKRTLMAAFAFSFLIETAQVFNHRLSDVADLLMNTLGACVGYMLWTLFSRKFQKIGKKTKIFSNAEPVVYILLGFVGVFLLFHWRLLHRMTCF
ncbi:MAG: VanZ family protein [Lachnospiraceae bacterium]|nr:VanZ family protein [Lachnospiraceae bacterium]